MFPCVVVVVAAAIQAKMSGFYHNCASAGQGFTHLLCSCLDSLRCLSSAVVFGVAFSGLVAYVVYQLFFHPLAKYPGPLLAKLTQWYDVYHAFIGDKHVLLYSLHQQYGPIVRYAPNALSINDPRALKAIHSHGANVQKAVFYSTLR